MVSNKIQSGIVYWICSPISRYNSVETVGNEEFNPIYMYENHDLAIARSSSSHADSGLRVAFKCLNV